MRDRWEAGRRVRHDLGAAVAAVQGMVVGQSDSASCRAPPSAHLSQTPVLPIII